MLDVNKYIGIPFKAHGRDISGFDCFGLCRYVLKEQFGSDLPEWIPEGDSASDLMKKYDEQWNHLEPIEEPEVGSVGLFNFVGMPIHMGLYIGDGMLLHVMINETSVAEKLGSRRLTGRLYGWYNLR
jgi:cell wall-associated NlpC family hydrolase